MVKERSLYWDTLKGFLIVLVVFGHCGTAVGNSLLSVVYSFHMPLFVLVSGFFSKKSEIIDWGGNIRLFVIYLVFDIAYLVLDSFGGGISVGRLLTPSFALWYILSLLIWRLILQLLPHKVLDMKTVLFITTICLALLSGFIHLNGELSFQRTFVYFPFFIAGYYLKTQNWISKIRNLNHWLFGSICLALLVFVYLYIPVMYSNICYNVLPKDMLMRGIQLVIAFVLCFCIFVIGREKITILTELGKYTLIIYLLHPPLIKILKTICLMVGHTPNIITAILITIISIAIICMIKDLRIFKYLR